MKKKKQKARTIYQTKRKEAALTQEAAAEILRISSHTIQNFEAGKREPKISMAFYMADVYGCDIQDFRPAANKTEEDIEETTV